MKPPQGPANAEIFEVSPTVRAGVTIGGSPISAEVDGRLIRVVVDNDFNLPGMFELLFQDFDGSTLGLAGVTLGAIVEITGGTTAGPGFTMAGGRLILGEVTAIEGVLDGQKRYTLVRGYTAAHRLQRARHSATYLNSTDSDIAVQVAARARLPVGQIDPTTAIHPYIAQVNQTDWEFLKTRAEEIGFETGVSGGEFYFRRIMDLTGPAVTLTFLDNLMSFRPRVSAANLTPDVEVRIWDPMASQAFAAPATVTAGGTLSPNALGAQFGEGVTGVASGPAAAGPALPDFGGSAMAPPANGTNLPAAPFGAAANDVSAAGADVGSLIDRVAGPAGAPFGSPVGAVGNDLAAIAPMLASLGPAPSPTAHVVNNRPLANGLDVATAGQAAATALGADLGGTFAEAEGEAFGSPAIQPGTMARVNGVQYPFGGDWLISHARHIFDDAEHGYRTSFAAHGRQDRSMLGLTAGGTGRRRHRATIDGVVCGVASNVLDPDGRGRVKVTLPWLSPGFETDWAPVGQLYAGATAGSVFLPSVGDEVLVAFEQGDPRRPYVLGSLLNNYSAFTLASGGPAALLQSLAGGLGGLAGSLASAAGGLEGLVGDIAQLTAVGQIMSATGVGPPMITHGSLSNIGSDAQTAVDGVATFATQGQVPNAGSLILPPGLTGMVGVGAAAMNDLNGAPLAVMTGTGGDAASAAMNDLSTGTMNAMANGMPGVPVGGANGSVLPGMPGGMPGGVPGAGLGAVQESPGMVGEVIRRGHVSSTGNVLMFNDQPLSPTGVPTGIGTPSPAGSIPAVGGPKPAGGTGPSMPGLLNGGGGKGRVLGAAAGPALASSVTLGAQNGTHGLYVDQVAAMVTLQSSAVPGVSMSEMPMLVISAGETGSIIINAGTDVTIASEGTLTMMAPEIMLAGETVTVVGELIPLTPG